MLAVGAERQRVSARYLGRIERPVKVREKIAAEQGITRSAAGIRLASSKHPDGAVWAVGNAPTALVELVRLAETGRLRPVLVVGMPVGFVGAVQAKAALGRSGLPALRTTTERGGATVAAAALNALLYFDAEDPR